jgi:hypothetical protein
MYLLCKSSRKHGSAYLLYITCLCIHTYIQLAPYTFSTYVIFLCEQDGTLMVQVVEGKLRNHQYNSAVATINEVKSAACYRHYSKVVQQPWWGTLQHVDPAAMCIRAEMLHDRCSDRVCINVCICIPCNLRLTAAIGRDLTELATWLLYTWERTSNCDSIALYVQP